MCPLFFCSPYFFAFSWAWHRNPQQSSPLVSHPAEHPGEEGREEEEEEEEEEKTGTHIHNGPESVSENLHGTLFRKMRPACFFREVCPDNCLRKALPDNLPGEFAPRIFPENVPGHFLAPPNACPPSPPALPSSQCP